MITKVKKYLIFGVKADLDAFYERAQKGGFLEFIREGKKLTPIPDEYRPLVTAIKFLKTFPGQIQEKTELDLQEALLIAEKILQLKEELIRTEEEKKVTLLERARIAPLGEFSFEDIGYLKKKGGLVFQFFSAKTGKGDLSLTSEEGLILLQEEQGMQYFLSIAKKTKVYPGLVEMHIESSVQDLKNRLAVLEESLQQIHEELKNYSKKIEALCRSLQGGLDRYYLLSAKQLAYSPIRGSSFFSVEVFIPVSKVALLEPLLQNLAIDFAEVVIEEEDRVPTVMENSGLNRIGEDLVMIYDVPSVADKDPSGWVFWCFSLFFAMIVADAGYGLIYLAFAAYIKWKFKTLKGMMQRMYRLMVVLALFVSIWGILTVSFFGLNISESNLLRKFSPLQRIVEAKADYHLEKKDKVYKEWEAKYPAVMFAKNGKEFIGATAEDSSSKKLSPVVAEFSNNVLLELSLVVGIIHIALSLLRYIRRGFAAIGWVLFLIGGYLFFPSMLRATSMINYLGILTPEIATLLGKNLIYTGIGAALFLSMMQNGLKGIKELMRLVEVFGDVLSYVRLYALSLAGAIMASTFNEIGVSVGIIGGFFVILAGHMTNMALGLMSGVIHGLRLNFIEWYHYSFTGEGKAFSPLKLIKSEED